MGQFVLQGIKTPPYTDIYTYMTLIQIISDHLSNKIHIPQIQEAGRYHGKRWTFFTSLFKYEVPNDISRGDSNDQDINILCPHTLCKYERNIRGYDWKGCYESVQKGRNTLRGMGMAFLGKGWNLNKKRHLNKIKCFQEWVMCVHMCMDIRSTDPLWGQNALRWDYSNKWGPDYIMVCKPQEEKWISL